MIQLFKSNKPTHGLVKVQGRWFLVFREDGVQRRASLGTSDDILARQHRDTMYAKLLAEGAVMCKQPPGRRKIRPVGHDGAFPDGVHYRNPWQAKVEGKSLGFFATMKEAEARVKEYKQCL